MMMRSPLRTIMMMMLAIVGFFSFICTPADAFLHQSSTTTKGLGLRNVFAKRSPLVACAYRPKVYAYFRSRSKIIEWWLQEMGVDYDTVQIVMDQKEHKSPSFVKDINPYGKLPVLEMENGQPLFESGAILEYLAFKFDKSLKTEEDRAIVSQWCHLANASLGPAIFMKEQREGGQMDKQFEVLEKLLTEKGPFLQGEKFTVSDVAVGSYLSYIPVFFSDIKLTAYPRLEEYVKTISQRPAFKATVGAPPPAPTT